MAVAATAAVAAASALRLAAAFATATKDVAFVEVWAIVLAVVSMLLAEAAAAAALMAWPGTGRTMSAEPDLLIALVAVGVVVAVVGAAVAAMAAVTAANVVVVAGAGSMSLLPKRLPVPRHRLAARLVSLDLHRRASIDTSNLSSTRRERRMHKALSS